jgi:Pilus formation protein N terminal region
LTNPGQPYGMRKLIFALVLTLTPAIASAADLTVALNEAVRLSLQRPAQDVIVGNPGIADVTVTDQHHLIITGKSAGITNLIVTDARGRTLFNRQLVVRAPDFHAPERDRVSVFNGAVEEEWACATHCEKTGMAAAVDALDQLSNATSALRTAAPNAMPPMSPPAPAQGAVQASPGTP